MQPDHILDFDHTLFFKFENLKNVKEAREQYNLTVEKLVCL